MGLKGKPETLRSLNKRLQQIPTKVAQKTATRIAPLLTQLSLEAYDQGKTVYGDARPLGVQANELDLKETEATRDSLEFKATGTVVRARLTTDWARFLIGKYKILPNGAVPTKWLAKIRQVAGEEFFKSTRR